MITVYLILACIFLGLAHGDISGQNPPAGSCLCASTAGSDLNVRGGPCSSTIVGSAANGACFKSLGSKTQCTLSGTSYQFFNFEYAGGTGWAAGSFLTIGDSSRCESSGGNCGDVRIYSRAEWGARPPRSTTRLSLPLGRAFIHHSYWNACYNPTSCMEEARRIQNFHMDSNGWSDVGYNYLVGEDGNVYEGRGWDNMGAHAGGHNSNSHGICIMGDFTSRMPNAAALKAVDDLIQCGVNQRKLTAGHTIHGHQNGVCTACPGRALYCGWVRPKPNFGGELSGGCSVTC